MSPEGLPPPPPPPPRDQRGAGRGLLGPGHAAVGPVGAARPHALASCSSARSSAAPATRRRSPTPSSWPTSARATSRASRSTTPTAPSPASSTDGGEFRTTGPLDGGIPDADLEVLRDRGRRGRATRRRRRASSCSLLPFLLPVAIFVAFFWFMQRRAQSQMGGIMSIGRSQAKTYSTERPGTTFADVAGYEGVKQEIKEVVDFLKTPEQLRARSAPASRRACCSSGPPGTGKTLIARAVAGEAGVPFLSVTGSDFMEMFVGVGASRVRDLFQTRPQDGPGDHLRRRDRLHRPQARRRPRRRPRRAGADAQPDALGDGRLRGHRGHRDDGGHQPARHPRPRPAAPRPLRPPGRRAAARARASAWRSSGCTPSTSASPPTSTSRVVARGTPGMSGADLSNLVNEAALFAVRERRRRDPPAPLRAWPATGCSWAPAASRWRCPTARRRSSPTTRPATPCAPPCSPTPTRVHKVTILPMGMALGVTQQLPDRGPPHLPPGLHRGPPRRRAWAAASPRTSCSA